MKTIAVDGDGTMVEYDRYRGVGVFGPPVPLMVERIKWWLDCGHEVVIFTSRVSCEHGCIKTSNEHTAIAAVLKDLELPELEITANKFTRFNEFWDDRSVWVKRNTGQTHYQKD